MHSKLSDNMPSYEVASTTTRSLCNMVSLTPDKHPVGGGANHAQNNNSEVHEFICASSVKMHNLFVNDNDYSISPLL
ncbi:hypothetical protein RIF29_29258 [Crotalaria pallida]|uniref:Uncharacterized protein n=1 Tax=Crotalaria pallida TaxID=3830 RepID=A0AAN9HXB4_CROPI